MADRPPCALMLQGAGSNVGKSLLTAGLCRAYARRGLRVRPFKPQNMSNNAAIAAGGGEIGRAQALQARASFVEPSVHMNPVLLKPASDKSAQVIVLGAAKTVISASDYQTFKASLLPQVLASFNKLKQEADLVLVEGAGSSSEVNLRSNDIANMGFALASQTPVVLVGDIDRGGVIAAIVGAHALMSESERALTRGFIINKFRGDPALFASAQEIMRQRTGFASFGLVPFFAKARLLPKEDAMALDQEQGIEKKGCSIKIAVPRLSRIANFDDLDPLASEDDVDLQMVEEGRPLPRDADLLLLPGTKATLADMRFLCANGWDVDIQAHVRHGGMVAGLCGGYQLLGRKISDHEGSEGPAGSIKGLGLLDVETVMSAGKTLACIGGVDAVFGEPVKGYEIHQGLTEGPDRARPWFKLDDGRSDGAMSKNGLIMGSYLHGMFAADGFRHAFLNQIREGRAKGQAYETRIDETLNALANHLETSLDLDRLLQAAK